MKLVKQITIQIEKCLKWTFLIKQQEQQQQNYLLRKLLQNENFITPITFFYSYKQKVYLTVQQIKCHIAAYCVE